MTRLLLLFSALFVVTVAGCNTHANYDESDGYMPLEVTYGEHAVIDLQAGEFIGKEDLAGRMAESDVVFVGESHEFALGHRAEHMLLQVMNRSTGTVAVSLEMFERDVQDHVNDYLAGRITEREFLKNSRPWGNYLRDYKPLVEYARRNNLPVIASNIPRRLAGKFAMAGYKGLTEQERKWVAREHYAPEGEYKERFRKTMEAMQAHGRGMGRGKMNIDMLFKAQAIKDDTMAEAIVEHIRSSEMPVIHFCGSFHSDYGLGTVERVKRLMPELNVLVIKLAQEAGRLEQPFEGIDRSVADLYISLSE